MDVFELGIKWGKYCNVVELVDEMMEWMEMKNIRRSEEGICSMLDTFFTNKESLIQMLAKSDNYDGKLRIKLDTQMCRYGNKTKIRNFVWNFYSNIDGNKIFYKTADANGKKMQDYFKVGKKIVTVADLVNGSMDNVKFSGWQDVFDSDGITKASKREANDFYDVINRFQDVCAATISEYDANRINDHHEALKIAKGTKTPRAFNKVCTHYGVDKSPKYNKLFAEYADMVSESKRSIKFYISVNPIDYLTMSNGRSWHSCHAVNGGYFGGTVSYMLDKVSFITFVFDDVPNNFATEGKIYRNMFHYKDGTLIQSRVYPQGNDGCTNLYDEFRGFVHNEFANILGKENKWYTDVNIHTVKRGNHYPDYQYIGNGTNMSSINQNAYVEMDIGHINICPYCGIEEPLSSCNIAHRSCTR